jgi:uncharacterized delta-60 repeat protein
MMKYLQTLGLILLMSGPLFAQFSAYPDSTFCGTGTKMFALGTFPINDGDRIVLQPDGKMVMTGVSIEGENDHLAKLGVCRLLPDGEFDTTFGVGGITLVDLGMLTDSYEYNSDILVQNDGTMLICGFTLENVTYDYDMLVCKLLANGNLDLSFGNGGKVWVDLYGGGAPDIANAITTDSAGNIYACGNTRKNFNDFSNDVAIIKLTPAGVLDSSFSGDGKLLLDLNGSCDYGYGIHVRSDGKIIIGGYSGYLGDCFALQLLPDGSYDNSFGVNGKNITDIFGLNEDDRVWDMTVDPDGKILLAGYGTVTDNENYFKGAIVRLTADGFPDPAFDADGITTFGLSESFNAFNSITCTNNGKYIAAGITYPPLGANYTGADFFVVRLMNDGSPDLTFNSTGMYSLDFGSSWGEDICYGLAVQPDQKIILSGTTVVTVFEEQCYSIARIIAESVITGFTSSNESICTGSQIQFANTSAGLNLSYQWTFEGGTPMISSLENPLITYSTPGSYDVQLIAFNNEYSDTLVKENFVQVVSIPQSPSSPVGPDNICNQQETLYSISPVPNTNSYCWMLDPLSSGTLFPAGIIATFTAADDWTGVFSLLVNASNQCGSSSYSIPFTGNVNHLPVYFPVMGDGMFCSGTSGAVITLAGSEIGVTYELYLDNQPTSSLLPGTGASLEWCNITTPGVYTVNGSTSYCSQFMSGQLSVSMINVPAQLSQPTGSTKTCNNVTDYYTTEAGVTGDLFVWTLTPSEAGIINQLSYNAEIEWSDSFIGDAFLSVHAENLCGEGAESEALRIEIDATDNPQVNGPESSCRGWTLPYETVFHEGSSYFWQVSGGTIVSGAGTSSVTIIWEIVGKGAINVIEINSNGCEGLAPDFTVIVDECVGFSQHGEDQKLKVFPNPSAGMVTVDGLGIYPEVSTLRIVDLSARVLFTISVPHQVNSLIISESDRLTPGIYLVEVLSDYSILERKLLIRK